MDRYVDVTKQFGKEWKEAKKDLVVKEVIELVEWMLNDAYAADICRGIKEVR